MDRLQRRLEAITATTPLHQGDRAAAYKYREVRPREALTQEAGTTLQALLAVLRTV